MFQRGKFAFTEEKWIKGKRESGEADEEADDASQQMIESESEEEEWESENVNVSWHVWRLGGRRRQISPKILDEKTSETDFFFFGGALQSDIYIYII